MFGRAGEELCRECWVDKTSTAIGKTSHKLVTALLGASENYNSKGGGCAACGAQSENVTACSRCGHGLCVECAHIHAGKCPACQLLDYLNAR